MTTRKTFKSRVRARMATTGESYTAARRQVVANADPPTLADETSALVPAPAAPPPAAAAPLVSDDAVRKATNRGWDEWFAILDDAGATAWSHRDTARWIGAEHGIPGWWAQNVTVAYERARGKRAANERPGGFTVSATKTVNVAAERVFRAFAEPDDRARWLDHAVRVRSATSPRNIRFDWADGSRVIVGITARGDAKAQVAIEHAQLPDAAAVERLRELWRPALAELKATLEAEAGPPGR